MNHPPSILSTSGRLFYLDALRSVLMILGIFYHAALVYSPQQSWIITNPEQSIFFEVFATITHSFRMPAFFIISGYFALLSLEKYGTNRFFSERTRRIIIPLVVTALSLNVLSSFLEFKFVHEVESLPTGFFRSYLPLTFVDGRWMQHLWFLVYLIFYFLFAIGWFRICQLPIVLKVNSRINRLFNLTLQKEGLYILALPFLQFIPLGLGEALPGIFYNNIAGLFTLFDLLYFLPFFWFGYYLFQNQSLHNEFTRLRAWHVGLCVIAVQYFIFTPEPAGIAGKAISFYAAALLSWLGSAFCFAIFYEYLNKPSNLFRYFSDASYSIYLFHHLLLIALGITLFSLPVSPFFKYLTLVVVAFSVSLAMHHFVILRSNLLKFLFNGKSLGNTARYHSTSKETPSA